MGWRRGSVEIGPHWLESAGGGGDVARDDVLGRLLGDVGWMDWWIGSLGDVGWTD